MPRIRPSDRPRMGGAPQGPGGGPRRSRAILAVHRCLSPGQERFESGFRDENAAAETNAWDLATPDEPPSKVGADPEERGGLRDGEGRTFVRLTTTHGTYFVV